MTHFYIYIQLISQDQTENVLNLLHFPSGLLLPTHATMKAFWTDGIQKYSSEYTDIKHLLPSVINSKLDTLRNEYFLPDSNVQDITIRKAFQYLDMSATNTLWSSTKLWSDQERKKHHAAFLNLQGKDYSLKQRGLSQYPTCLTTYFEVIGHITLQDVQPWFTSMLAQSLNERLLSTLLFGAANYSIEPESEHKASLRILNNLDKSPPSIAALGQKADALHPWIIADTKLCQDISRLLPTEVRVVPIDCEPASSLSILEIPKAIAASPEAAEPARDFLICAIPKDTSLRQPQDFGKRFSVSGATFFTQRHYNQLRVNDQIPPENSLKWLPLIHRRYCDMMKIDDLDMLVQSAYPENEKRLQEEIDSVFMSLSETMSVEERIWEAHVAVWKQQYPPRPQEFFILVHDMFFQNIPNLAI